MWFKRRMKRVEAQRRFGIKPNTHGSGKAIRRRMATREHVDRLADGGAKGVRNMVWACSYCNHNRQDKDPFEHLVAMCRAVALGQHPNHPPREEVRG